MYPPTLIYLTLLSALLNHIHADNKFMNTVRNLTNSNNGTKQKETENYRKKIEKYLGECRGDSDDYSASSEQDQKGQSSDPRAFRRGADGATYPAHYGKKPQQTRNYRSRNDNGNVDGYLTNYGEQNGCENRNNGDRRSFNNGGPNKNFGESYDQNRNYYDNQQGRYDQRQEYDNRGFNEGFPRWKRDYNDKCVSQCVFSYLELLDENRSPSESAFVQFLQENISNDRERVKVVREARRCFAKFVTTEEEDGCEFSKSLNKCLRLNLD